MASHLHQTALCLATRCNSISSASALLLFRLCFSALLLLPFHGCASPILAPNFSSCHLPVNLPLGQSPFNCCPPPSSHPLRLFRPSSNTTTLRVRRPAHAINESYAHKLARAYNLMKALPSDDPRSFYQQANIHCAYCNSVYDQLGSDQLFQVHDSWLFFPFHRWYLFFHERILAKLLGGDPDADGDDKFALSFWNYDHPDGASIPRLFSSSSFNSTLASHLREQPHESSEATIAIDYTVDTDGRPRHTQLRENDNAIYRALVRDASTLYNFLGWPLRQGDTPMVGFGAGTVELRPHDTVHLWVGSKTQIGWKDMGSFFAAARDPLFYAHHAQLDRLWEIWKTLHNNSKLLDEDYLNAEFVFYNEDAELVRVKVGDALDTANLGYAYEQVETPWLDAIPTKLSSGPAVLTSSDIICTEGEPILVPCSIAVERDPAITRESPWLHDRLVIEIQYDPLERSHIDVYLNLPTANGSMDTGCKEFLYFISTKPNFVTVEEHSLNVTHRPDISERLDDLGLTDESSIVVTLVPRFFTASKAAMTFLGCFIEYTLPTERWDTTSSSSFTKPDISERLDDLGLTDESSIVVTLVPRFSTASKAAMTFLECFIEYTLPTERWDTSSSSSFTK